MGNGVGFFCGGGGCGRGGACDITGRRVCTDIDMEALTISLNEVQHNNGINAGV